MDDAAVSSLYDRQDETADALSAHIRIIVPERKTPKGGRMLRRVAGVQTAALIAEYANMYLEGNHACPV